MQAYSVCFLSQRRVKVWFYHSLDIHFFKDKITFCVVKFICFCELLQRYYKIYFCGQIFFKKNNSWCSHLIESDFVLEIREEIYFISKVLFYNKFITESGIHCWAAKKNYYRGKVFVILLLLKICFHCLLFYQMFCLVSLTLLHRNSIIESTFCKHCVWKIFS